MSNDVRTTVSVLESILECQIDLFSKVDLDYGMGVRHAFKMIEFESEK